MVESYPGPMGQGLSNLISNSLLHAFDSCSSGLITVRVQTDPETGWAWIRYSDDGVGISPSSLPRVFDPFYTTKLGQGGTGLGMYISHNIVCDLLGGSIKIESPAGSGAIITVKIPPKAPMHHADDHPTPAAVPVQ